MAPEIITRGQARAQGLLRYYTGKPCKRGHIAERQVSNLTCMECDRAVSRAAYLKRDRETERQRLRVFREANREKINAASREANKTPERIAYMAAWYEANRERIEAKRKEHPGKYRESNIASAKAWKAANLEEGSRAWAHGSLHSSRAGKGRRRHPHRRRPRRNPRCSEPSLRLLPHEPEASQTARRSHRSAGAGRVEWTLQPPSSLSSLQSGEEREGPDRLRAVPRAAAVARRGG
jgi:hypothetical protein